MPSALPTGESSAAIGSRTPSRVSSGATAPITSEVTKREPANFSTGFAEGSSPWTPVEPVRCTCRAIRTPKVSVREMP